ncbi:MAG: DUF5683 domain-containing protein [Prolixibacteraceae bacterium]
MEPFAKCIVILLFGFFTIQLDAQETKIEHSTDSLHNNLSELPGKVHLPGKATIYSAVLPGLGQVYNRQWWKVPFIYGGFGALAYYINGFNTASNTYLQAYYDLKDLNPATTSYQQFYDQPVDELSPPSSWVEYFKGKVDSNTRSRNLYMIGAAGFYLINILDANVNAHFIDFDISEDLTLNVVPIAIDPYSNLPIPGMTLVFNF